jgi:hypothetical protein
MQRTYNCLLLPTTEPDQRAESREQRAESREQRAESREQRAEREREYTQICYCIIFSHIAKQTRVKIYRSTMACQQLVAR